MPLFRLFLLTCLIAIAVYTSVTIANHGLNFLPTLIGDLAEMGWPGQFDLDFLSFLLLGTIWVAWRHQFSPAGIGLSLLVFPLGMLFLASYLLVQIGRSGGDMKVLLLGEGRA